MLDSFSLGRVFATVPRRSESGKHGGSAKTRGRLAKWQLLPLALVLAGTAGGLSYTFYPSAAVGPVADRLSPGAFSAVALGNLLGQGQVTSAAPMPAPIVTATAKARAAKPAHSAHPTAHPTSSHTSGVSLADAAGLGFYDGESSPAGIETAAKWLGSTSSIKYAQDFIDATDWSHISNPWQLSNWKGSPFQMVWGVPMLPCGAPATQCATNVSDYNLVANGGADSYFKTLAQNLVVRWLRLFLYPARLGIQCRLDGLGHLQPAGSGLTSWASDFVPAFRNIVTSMRSVSGANFKFIWNPIDSSNASCSGASLEKFYPGDSYVDVVALDVYDGIGARPAATPPAGPTC